MNSGQIKRWAQERPFCLSLTMVEWGLTSWVYFLIPVLLVTYLGWTVAENKTETVKVEERQPLVSVPSLTGGKGFETALKFSLKWEGRCSDVRGDYGGRTFMGITHAQSKRFLGVSDPCTLSRDQVVGVYKRGYWDLAKCDQYPELRNQITCFDTAVNYGVGFLRYNFFNQCTKDNNWWQCIVQERKKQRYRQASRPLQGQFLRGWLNRDNDLYSYLINLGK